MWSTVCLCVFVVKSVKGQAEHFCLKVGDFHSLAIFKVRPNAPSLEWFLFPLHAHQCRLGSSNDSFAHFIRFKKAQRVKGVV